ncbi:MAG: transcriptional regulator [Nanoarchaeota archaeon]
MKLLPQELEVWYLIPALRRELAKILISDFGMSQKQVSQTLEITESAVSQYLKSKRGSELKFSKEDIEKIRESAYNLVENGSSSVNEEIYKLSIKFRANNALCNFHKRGDKTVHKDCDLCLDITHSA